MDGNGPNCGLFWGEVTEAKPGWAKVYLPEDDIVTDFLQVIKPRAMNDDANWMLEPQEQVAVILMMTPDNMGDTGVILGATTNDVDKPDGDAAQGMFRMRFSDGGFLEYNKNTHKYSVTVGNDGEIIFNGGSNNGMVKVAQLVEKLNNVESDLNDLKSKYAAMSSIVSGLASSLALPAAVGSPVVGGTLAPYFAALSTNFTPYSSATLTPTMQSDLENEKVKH